LKEFIESRPVVITISVLTFYALFGDDFRLGVTYKGADPYFNVITCICLFFFGLEVLLSSIAINDYFLSLYFWLDLLSTITLIADITWIWD
jgi:hypothetical protein